MGEDRRTPEDRTDELIAELRDRVRALEESLEESKSAAPARRTYDSWWKERFGAAMVGMVVAFAVLAANGGENPLRVGGGEEQAGVRPAPTTEPAPRPRDGGGGGGGAYYAQPAPAPTTIEPAAIEPVASEPAPEPSSEPAPAPSPIPPSSDPGQLMAQ